MMRERLLRTLTWSVVDYGIVLLGYSLAFSARSLTAPIDYLNSLPFILASGLIIWFSLYISGVYRRLWSHTSGHGVAIIVQGMTISGAILFVLDVGSGNPRPLPLSVLLLGHIVSFGGLVVVRYRSRLIGAFEWRWRAVWRGEFPEEDERVLIVGAGESGQTSAWRMRHRFDNAKAHYHIVGFVDDDASKQGMYVEGRPVLGTIADIGRVARDERVDLIVVAIHRIDGPGFRRILELCEQTEARIKVVPDMLKLMNATQSKQFLRDVEPQDLIGRTVVTRHEDVDMSPIMGRVVLITGAAGSIGSELSRQMVNYNPQRLVILDNNESALHDLHISLMAAHPTVDIVPALVDVSREADVNAVFAEHDPQIVYHAAAYKHVPMLEKYPNEAVRVNIGGTLHVAQAALAADVERFVLISTDKAVHPSSVMGATKRVCELLVHALAQSAVQTRITAVRFGNVLGSRGSVVPTFNRQIDGGGPVTVTHPEMSRYFMSIAEAVNLVIHASAMTDGDDMYVLRMGEEVRIVDIAERMIRLRGLRPYTDVPIEFIGIRPGEKLHEDLYDAHEQPQPTRHPYILQVSQWGLHVPSTRFVEDARQLAYNGLTGDKPLLTLQHLCEGEVAQSYNSNVESES